MDIREIIAAFENIEEKRCSEVWTAQEIEKV